MAHGAIGGTQFSRFGSRSQMAKRCPTLLFHVTSLGIGYHQTPRGLDELEDKKGGYVGVCGETGTRGRARPLVVLFWHAVSTKVHENCLIEHSEDNEKITMKSPRICRWPLCTTIRRRSRISRGGAEIPTNDSLMGLSVSLPARDWNRIKVSRPRIWWF